MFQADRIFFQADAVNFQALLDLYETEDELVVEMDVPGISQKDIVINVFDDMLVVEGARRKEYEGKRLKYICLERNFESFRRVVRIPVHVDCMNAKASYNEGVLKITFPKLGGKVIKIKIEK